MPGITLAELIQKPFDALGDLVADDSPPRSVYSGVRTRGEGLYTQTNTQPGSEVYAVDERTESAERTTGPGQETTQAETYDCPDPVVCDTCTPPASVTD